MQSETLFLEKNIWVSCSQSDYCGAMQAQPRDGTLVGYTFSKRYKKVSPHRKLHNLPYNLLREKNKPSPEMVNKRGYQLDRPGL